MALEIDTLPDEAPQFEAYMSALDDKQLDRLTEALEARFAKLSGDEDNVDEEVMSLLNGLAVKIKAARVHKSQREQDALNTEAQEAAARQKAVLAKLRASVDGTPAPDTAIEGKVVASDGASADTFARQFLDTLATLTAQLQVKGPDLNRHIRDLPLSAAARHAPDPKVQPRRSEPVLVASSDIPGHKPGNRLETFDELVRTMHARARMMGVTNRKPNWVPVATMERDFRYRLALDSTPEEVDEVLMAATDTSALVAAGGWCAPSEISYDFYNIVAEDGLVDLPSVGVLNRGGLRYPVSPGISSIFSDANALWSWTELEDYEAANNTSEVKTCARVPCPTFSEKRTACDGLCVTVGNLVDFAYPELVANHIRLTFAARAHRTNQLVIAAMVADAITQTVTLTATLLPADQSGVASILSAVELQAIDTRYRYRMAAGSILEAIFPIWMLGIFRADLANRGGVDLLSVTNGQIADWLNQRGVRAQFVYDWQGGFSTDAFGHPSTEITAWPTTGQFLMYPAGTYVRGQGLQLDLGIVRDSALNENNDHTGAWMEDCYAIAAVGHESRLVTVNTRVTGEVGAAVVGAQT